MQLESEDVPCLRSGQTSAASALESALGTGAEFGGAPSRDSVDTAPGFVHLCRSTGVKPWAREERTGGECRTGKGRAGKGGEGRVERMGKGRTGKM